MVTTPITGRQPELQYRDIEASPEYQWALALGLGPRDAAFAIQLPGYLPEWVRVVPPMEYAAALNVAGGVRKALARMGRDPATFPPEPEPLSPEPERVAMTDEDRRQAIFDGWEAERQRDWAAWERGEYVRTPASRRNPAQGDPEAVEVDIDATSVPQPAYTLIANQTRGNPMRPSRTPAGRRLRYLRSLVAKGLFGSVEEAEANTKRRIK